jgi:bacterioferritin
MKSPEIVILLNNQLNREVNTFLRYMLRAASIKGAEYETVRNRYLKEVPEEVEHAQYLANQIVALGGTPVLKPELRPVPMTIRRMLADDIDEEGADVKNYLHLASLAEQAGLAALKMKMEERAADEDEHRQEMQRLLG